jgi:hypothetical protein
MPGAPFTWLEGCSPLGCAWDSATEGIKSAAAAIEYRRAFICRSFGEDQVSTLTDKKRPRKPKLRGQVVAAEGWQPGES